jgi:glutathione S-transferase
MISIYDFAHGARGMRLAWMCEEMALEHAFVALTFPTDPGYRKLNPFGTVPYLHDGDVGMSESVAAMLYLAQKYGPTGLLPAVDNRDYAAVLQWTLFGEASLAAMMTPLLAARFGAPADKKRNWSAVGLESRVKATIDQLDAQLAGRPCLVGANLSLADISVSTALAIWRGGLAQALPASLQSYCENLQARPAYQRASAAHS